MRRNIYSQSGQDALAEFLLKRNGLIPKVGEYVGTYIDVGACHPVEYSNTYGFYEKGWRGVCVEPNPDLAELFFLHRPEDRFLSCALGEIGSKKTLHRFSNPQWNTFDARRVQRIERHYEGRIAYLGSLEINIRTLADVVENSGLKNIDILSIDVEGFEIAVCRGMNWQLTRPKLVVLESIIPIEQAAASETITFLTGQGYLLAAHTGHDAFLIDAAAVRA